MPTFYHGNGQICVALVYQYQDLLEMVLMQWHNMFIRCQRAPGKMGVLWIILS